LTGDPGGTGAAGAADRGGWRASGNEVKYSLAIRASSIGSRRPAVKPSGPNPLAALPLPGTAATARLASLGLIFVLMVLSHVYVFEQGDGVVGKHGG
jgi:hypothetical protein